MWVTKIHIGKICWSPCYFNMSEKEKKIFMTLVIIQELLKIRKYRKREETRNNITLLAIEISYRV